MAVYEDFEPFCKWQREQGRDTLEVHLQGFKKDQMKIHLSNVGVMSISGQRPLDENKSVWSRFKKEIKLSKNYNNNEIHAKLSGGVLYIIMPKTTPTFQEPATTLPPENQENELKNRTLSTFASNLPQDQFDSGEEIMKGINYGGFRLQDLVNNRKIAGNVVVAVAVAIVIGAFAIYKYSQPTSVDN